jgi:PAS domain S-box-containing protein
MMERPNILLVDDQPKNLVALEAMLSDLEVRLVTADSGTAALRCLLEDEFAVILLDVMMPEMDGFTTAELIRQRDRSRNTPIIFITALSRSETNVFKGYSLGAVDYLFKPIVPEILRSKVAVFVELFRRTLQLEEQKRELQHLSRQNELILNSAADGVLGVDREGRITFINSAGGELLGTSDSTGEPLHPLLHPPELSREWCRGDDCQLVRAISGHQRVEIHDGLFWKSDGTNFPVEYSGTPMIDDAGSSIGAVLIFRDVTERRAAARASESERLYRQEQAANRAKDEFLATLSHELRTPMTAILGWVRMIRMGGLDEETFAAALEAIERSSHVQAQLIEDILDVSRIVAGKLQLKVERVNLPRLVERAIDTVRQSATEKNIELLHELSNDCEDATVDGDANRLQQVFWNLLSNAVKFTSEGGTVTTRIACVDGYVRVGVTDSGQGIAPDFLPHVFDRFRQANSSGTRSHGGLGLGLAIVRHMTELHGGSVTASSEGEGHGSTFTVFFPLSEQKHRADEGVGEETIIRRRADRQSRLPRLNAWSILVVDDDASVRELLLAVLRRGGAECQAAASVAEAMTLVEANSFDLIVTDVAMPQEDGFALLSKVREHEKGRDVQTPVIALTAFGREEDRERAMAAGFSRHLSKPIDPIDLIEVAAATITSGDPSLAAAD